MQINPAEVQWDAAAPPAQPPAQDQTAVPPAAPAPAPANSAPDASSIVWDDHPQAAAPQAQSQPAPQDHSATNDEMRRMFHAGKSTQEIVDYGVHHGLQPDHDQIEHARANGMDVQFVQPENKPAPTHTDIKSAIGDGIIDSLDTFFPGVANLIRGNPGAGKALTEHAANAAGGDYGPEIGGFLDTATSPSQWGNFGSNLDKNVAAERNQIATDSEGHPIASIAGELTGAGLTAPLAGAALKGVKVIDAAAQAAPKLTSAAKSAVGGAIYGSGAAGPDNRAAGAVTGAALGAATDVAAPYVIKALPVVGRAISNAVSRGPSVTPEAAQAASAAQDLGVDLPAFAVNGPKAQAKAATLTRRGGFGATTLGQSAQTAIDQSKAARDSIASDVGTPQALDANLGDDIKNAAIDQRTSERARIGGMFNSGDQQMGDTPIFLKQTTQALNGLEGQDAKAIVPSPVTPLVRQIQQRIKDVNGSMTAADLRTSVQNLKGLMSANSIDANTSDHVMSVLRDAMNGDMETAAKQSGNESALQTYQDAREQWAASKLLDKTTLKPMLGAAFQNNGDQVVTAIKNAVKNNGSRVAQLFSALPDDVANTARASLISRMGTPLNGGPEDYSLSELLKNYNQLQGSRNLIFSAATNAALQKLGSVAQLGKPLETVAQNGAKAQPFGIKKLMTTGPAMIGEAASMITHDPKDVAVGAAISALNALGQWRSAKLLANPDFAKRIAAIPLNPKASEAFWSRPWVNAMAAKNPAIAAEIQVFQHAVNDNLRQMPAAASNPNGPGQNQQPNGTQP